MHVGLVNLWIFFFSVSSIFIILFSCPSCAKKTEGMSLMPTALWTLEVSFFTKLRSLSSCLREKIGLVNFRSADYVTFPGSERKFTWVICSFILTRNSRDLPLSLAVSLTVFLRTTGCRHAPLDRGWNQFLPQRAKSCRTEGAKPLCAPPRPAMDEETRGTYL